MADTTTTNYGLVKPEVGASNDTWGNKTNGNWDALDAALKAASDIANAAMPKAGGTFTGAVNFTGALTKDGNAVWHAGNFTPGDYAKLSGAIFTGAVQVKQLVTDGTVAEGIKIDAATPYLSFNNTAGTTRFGYIQHAGIGGAMLFTNQEAAQYNFTNALTMSSTLAAFNGNLAAKGQIAITPTSDPGAITSTFQFRANESSNNPGYHADFGYWNSGSGWRGYINAVAGGSAANLDVQPGGGEANFGGVVRSASILIGKGGGTGEGVRVSAASPYLTFYNSGESTRFGYIIHTGVNGNLVIANEQASGQIQVGFSGLTNLVLTSTSTTVNGPLNVGGQISGWLNVDSTYRAYINTNPILQFDTNDYFVYDRTANQLTLNIGGAGKFSVDSTGSGTFLGGVSASKFDAGSNFYFTLVSGLPVVNFAPNCFLQYSTTNSTYYLYNNGQTVMSIDASGNVKFRGNVTGNTVP